MIKKLGLDKQDNNNESYIYWYDKEYSDHEIFDSKLGSPTNILENIKLITDLFNQIGLLYGDLEINFNDEDPLFEKIVILDFNYQAVIDSIKYIESPEDRNLEENFYPSYEDCVNNIFTYYRRYSDDDLYGYYSPAKNEFGCTLLQYCNQNSNREQNHGEFGFWEHVAKLIEILFGFHHDIFHIDNQIYEKIYLYLYYHINCNKIPTERMELNADNLGDIYSPILGHYLNEIFTK